MLLLSAGGCGTPTNPDDLQPLQQQLQISCPAVPQPVESIQGTPVGVAYLSPQVFGGIAPVNSSCSPASGSNFPVGTTPVTCTATDAQLKSASCAFSVTVTRPGVLSATRFLAFGDSMTEGALPGCPVGTSALTGGDFLRRDLPMIRAAVNVPSSYPSVLGGLLSARYVTQAPVVTNVGLSGERVSDLTWGTNDVTVARLRTEVAAFTPQIVFLFEGINDINVNLLHPEVTIPAVVKGLRDLAREARNRGVSQVFIATLLPQQSGACRGYSVNQMASANDQIRAMVAADRHVLVDLYEAFGGAAAPYIGVDGLHPNQLGYQKIAQTFLETIRTRLEVPR